MARGMNDCVFCSNERDNDPSGDMCPWCSVFGEPIADNRGYVPHEGKHSHSGQAKRSQDNCSGFELDPQMESNWHNRFD